MSNKQSTLNQFDKYKGQFVIIHNDVKQFVAIAQDPNDYLYVMYDGRKLSFHTILESMVILKGKIDDKDYNEFVRIAELNFYSSEKLWGNDSSKDNYDEGVKGASKHKKELENQFNDYDETELMSEMEWGLVRNIRKDKPIPTPPEPRILKEGEQPKKPKG